VGVCVGVFVCVGCECVFVWVFAWVYVCVGWFVCVSVCVGVSVMCV
jgi:hypothetical protein